jgi:hypothetical protein
LSPAGDNVPSSLLETMRPVSDNVSMEKVTNPAPKRRLLVAARVVVVLSYILSYAPDMTVLNFRTDERSERALTELMSDGSTASEAIRQALVDAVRLRRREQMRTESYELMNDEEDLAESRRVLADMDEIRAW